MCTQATNLATCKKKFPSFYGQFLYVDYEVVQDWLSFDFQIMLNLHLTELILT